MNVMPQAPLAPSLPKSKTTAVLLAVFLSFWTWLYTYKVDSWKFWLNLALSVLTIGIWALFVASPWAIIDAARRPAKWYEAFPNGDALAALAVPAAALAVPAATGQQQPLAAPSLPPPAGPPVSGAQIDGGSSDSEPSTSADLTSPPSTPRPSAP